MDTICGCGENIDDCTEDVCVSIQLWQPGAYCYPPATLDDEAVSSGRYDKVVTGVLHFDAKRETRVGPIKLAWEVSHEPHGRERTVLARYESTAREGDSLLPEGKSSTPFAITVTHLLPPYTTTCFDLCMNRLFASILQPVPDYTSSTSGPSGTATPPERPVSARSHTSTPTPSIRTTTSSTRVKEKNKSWLRNLLPNRRVSSDDDENSGPVAVPETYAPHTNYARAWRRPRPHPLPESLQPSLAWASTPCGVLSCPDRPGELPEEEWSKTMRVRGLGKVDVGIYSAYFACGSGLDFELVFSELDPSATIQAVQLSIAEVTTAGQACVKPGEQDIIWFSLLTIGSPDAHRQHADDNLWRGGVPASYDRLASASSGKKKGKDKSRKDSAVDTGPIVHPDCAPADDAPIAPDSFNLRRQCRLPSPIVGIHASAPRLLDPRISRHSHRIRVEVLFSVLGQDEKNQPLPIPKSGQVPEGTVRRLWVDHEVVLRVCLFGPDNTLVPPYEAPTESFQAYLTRIEIRRNPKDFTIANSKGRVDSADGTNDLRERTEEHIDDCQARCLCFYGDNAIYELVKKRAGSSTAADADANGNEGGGEGDKAVYEGAANTESGVSRAE